VHVVLRPGRCVVAGNSVIALLSRHKGDSAIVILLQYYCAMYSSVTPVLLLAIAVLLCATVFLYEGWERRVFH
jgi:hypothetical protein